MSLFKKVSENTLYLTVGLPRSGKSTWAESTGWPIVNRDSIRYAIGGTIRYFEAEDKVNEIERIMIKALFCAGHKKVIVDATHLKQKYIDGWDKFATLLWTPYRNDREPKDRNFEIELVKFHTAMDVCMQRAREDFPEDKKFPSIIKSMWASAETIEIPEVGLYIDTKKKREEKLNQTLGYMRLIKGDL